MPYSVKTERRILLLIIGGAALVFIGMPAALSYHDSRTEQALLRTVERELPPQASMAQMDAFMRRHTERYSMNSGDAEPEFAGFVPQAAADKILLDRAVRLALKVNRDSATFKGAEVEVFYTGP